MIKSWRYLLSFFVGLMLVSAWISFSIQAFNGRGWWVFPLTIVVGCLLFGGGIAIGLWWDEKP